MKNKLNILVVEPFYADSHKLWLDGLKQYSQHNIQMLTLPGRHWKWRMHGAAITLAAKFRENRLNPDLIICSSMLDVNIFIAQLRKEIAKIPVFVYFHENQISYPWSPDDKDKNLSRDRHYGFLNYSSALSADKIFFNSYYHLTSFIDGLHDFLKAFPDHQNLETIDFISKKSEVLYLGMDLKRFETHIPNEKNEIPILIWNHRWEFDKNPELFFKTLFQIKSENIAFKLIVLGKEYAKCPKIFHDAKISLQNEIIHWGYAEDEKTYIRLLKSGDILPVTSNQDFFGISVVEAIYCGLTPLLPNRLAYPEHITGEQFFYDSDTEFYSKLKEMIMYFSKISKPNLNKIYSYDWPNIIGEYDSKFKSLISAPN